MIFLCVSLWQEPGAAALPANIRNAIVYRSAQKRIARGYLMRLQVEQQNEVQHLKDLLEANEPGG
jgi:hypothetical protein